MNNVKRTILGICGALVLTVTATGCASSELKYLAINQLVGLATAVTSAASTSLIQSILGSSTQ